MPVTAGAIIRASDYSGIMAAPLTGTGNGTATSGTTETVDAVLGTYTFTALAVARYRIIIVGRAISNSVANDRFSLKFRYTTDGSTPTAASAQWGGNDWISVNGVTGGAGAEGCLLIATAVPGAATIKVVTTWVRATGTGVGTPIGTCAMWAEAMGNV